MNFLLFVLLISIIIITNVSPTEMCNLLNGEESNCTAIEKCVFTLNEIKINHKEPKYCGEKVYGQVCCEKVKLPRKSEQKCLEYIQYAYEETKEIPEDLDNEYDLVYIDQCGIKSQTYTIIGGEDTGSREFPHMTAIGDDIVKSNGTTWFCGGSLISENFVLTAAHCIATNVQIQGRTITPTVVKLGALNFDINNEEYTQIIAVEHSILHPEYKSTFVYHDIGLLKLKKSAILNSHVKPACLPTEEPISKTAIITGWGKTEESGNDGVLQKLELQFVEHNLCGITYDPKRSSRVPKGLIDELLCFGNVIGKDACPGASGGPLQVINKKMFCSYNVIGVASAGVKPCGEGHPGLYTNVVKYLDWIENIVWGQN